MRDENGAIRILEEVPEGIVEVAMVGTGAVAIQRQVFEQLDEAGYPWPYFRYIYKAGSDVLPSEDIYFGECCEAAGIPHYLDSTVETPHLTELAHRLTGLVEAVAGRPPRRCELRQDQHGQRVGGRCEMTAAPAPTQVLRPVVDVIIPGYENLPLTRKLLRSLEQTSIPFHVIYVDNGSSPYDVGMLLGDHPTMTLIRLNWNYGFVRAINSGMAQALMSPAKYILWLNNDVEVPKNDPDWLTRLIQPMEEDATVGATGAVSNNVFGLQRYEQAGPDWGEAPILIGFAMCIRKEAARAVGFLDEKFGMGNYEDWDYSLRLRDKGWRLLVVESVWLKHVMHATFDKMSLDFNALLQKNLDYLIGKWGVEKLAALGVMVGQPEQLAQPEAPAPKDEGITAALPPLDDYAAMMPVIESWEKGQAEFLGGLLFDALTAATCDRLRLWAGNVPAAVHGSWQRRSWDWTPNRGRRSIVNHNIDHAG